MLNVEKILYATDFSPTSRQALAFALLLARKLEAGLEVFHALVPHWEHLDVPEGEPATAKALMARLEANAGAEMEQFLAATDTAGVKITRSVEKGSYSAPVILEHAAASGAGLIVLGTHGRRGPGRLLVGSVAEEVVRRSPVPVATVKQQGEKPVEPKIERIAVPIDFSAPARRSLDVAKDLAVRFGGRLLLLHVVEQVALPSFYVPGAPGVFPQNPMSLQPAARDELLAWMAATGEPEVPFDARVLPGSPPVGIADFATAHRADLIVLSTLGLTGIERLLLGSTAERVVRQAPLPVAVIKAAA